MQKPCRRSLIRFAAVFALLVAALPLAAADAPSPKFDEKKIKQWTLKGPLGETPRRITETLPLSDQPNKASWDLRESTGGKGRQ